MYKMLDTPRHLRDLHFRRRKIYKIRKNPYNELTSNEFRKKYKFSKVECLFILLLLRWQQLFEIRKLRGC